MNAGLSRFLSGMGAAVLLVGAGTVGAPDVMAGDRYRHELRRHNGQVMRAAAVDRDRRQHERERRAFVAGAAVQQHRNDNRNYYRGGYRDGYGDRYRDRYYEGHDDHDNKIGAALVGAAVGAVVTGAVMSNRNNANTSNAKSDSRQ